MRTQYLVLILSLSVNAHREHVHPKSWYRSNTHESGDSEAWLFNQAKEKTIYVGLNFYLDTSFQNSLIYENESLYYLASFTKAVEMRFWGQTAPRVEFVFSGLHWLNKEEQSEIEVLSGDKLDGRKTLKKLTEIVAKQLLTIEESDVLLLLTGLNVTEGRDSAVQGISYFAGACGPKRVAIVEDDGRTFSGANAAAQQVAHLLGATYDGTIPLATRCTESDGYIMTKHPYLWKHHRFSSCSKIMMRFSYGFEMSSRWRCLGTEPKKVEYYPPKLPSVFFASLTSKSYCSVLSNPGYVRNCQLRGVLPECMLTCCSTRDNSLISVPAPDGYYCRGNMVCLGGKCETEEPAKKPR